MFSLLFKAHPTFTAYSSYLNGVVLRSQLLLPPRLLYLQCFSNVNLLVSFQILPSAEALSTLVTVVRFLPRVDPLVFLQVSRLTEAPPTLHAAVWLLSRMTTLVDSQIPNPAERLPTDDTHMRVIFPQVFPPDFSHIKGDPVVFSKCVPPR